MSNAPSNISYELTPLYAIFDEGVLKTTQVLTWKAIFDMNYYNRAGSCGKKYYKNNFFYPGINNELIILSWMNSIIYSLFFV